MRSVRSGKAHRADFDVLCEFATHCEASSADGANEIATAGKLSHLERLAEPEVPQLVAGGTFEETNLKITPYLRLSEALEAVDLKILCGLLGHLGKDAAIETQLQQQLLLLSWRFSGWRPQTKVHESLVVEC